MGRWEDTGVCCPLLLLKIRSQIVCWLETRTYSSLLMFITSLTTNVVGSWGDSNGFQRHRWPLKMTFEVKQHAKCGGKPCLSWPQVKPMFCHVFAILQKWFRHQNETEKGFAISGTFDPPTWRFENYWNIYIYWIALYQIIIPDCTRLCYKCYMHCNHCNTVCISILLWSEVPNSRVDSQGLALPSSWKNVLVFVWHLEDLKSLLIVNYEQL